MSQCIFQFFFFSWLCFGGQTPVGFGPKPHSLEPEFWPAARVMTPTPRASQFASPGKSRPKPREMAPLLLRFSLQNRLILRIAFWRGTFWPVSTVNDKGVRLSLFSSGRIAGSALAQRPKFSAQNDKHSALAKLAKRNFIFLV